MGGVIRDFRGGEAAKSEDFFADFAKTKKIRQTNLRDENFIGKFAGKFARNNIFLPIN